MHAVIEQRVWKVEGKPSAKTLRKEEKCQLGFHKSRELSSRLLGIPFIYGLFFKPLYLK